MRLRPEQHLRLQGDIRAVREQGRRVDCRAFTIWWLDRPPVSGTRAIRRAAVVASIAAVGHAVLRNRAKRRLREIFRQHQNLLPAGCDLLMVSRAAVNARPFPELEKLFIEACGRMAPAA
jgi:ribonuclease P protein component